MSNVLISIIIPHFNRPQMLSRLLSTIPNLSYIEVLVIDDHSTEELHLLHKCMKEYSGRNILFYKNAPAKKGAGSARNTGIQFAKGKYLLFADSDDWFLPNWENYVLEVLNNDSDIVFFPPTSQFSNGGLSSRHNIFSKIVFSYLHNPTHVHEVQLKYLYCSPWSKLIKQTLLKEHNILFDEAPYSEDMIFSGKLSFFAKKIQASNKTIYCILDHEGCNTAIMNRNAIMFRQKMNNRYYSFLRVNLNRKDRKCLKFPYSNDYYWITSIIYILLFELQHERLPIKSQNRLLCKSIGLNLHKSN